MLCLYCLQPHQQLRGQGQGMGRGGGWVNRGGRGVGGPGIRGNRGLKRFY